MTAGARSLKREFLLDPAVTFLNHGSFGACPRPVMEAFQAWQLELEREPVELLLRRGPELLEGATAALAAYVGCATETLALVPNATFGMNMVARSLTLARGRPGAQHRSRVRRGRHALAVRLRAQRRDVRPLRAARRP